MRISDQFLTVSALVIVSLAASLFEIGFVFTLVVVVAVLGFSTLIRLKVLLSPKSDILILECITVSHYVEKVRWALDWLKVPYQEQHDIGILGVLLKGRTVPTLRDPGVRSSIGDSKAILRYLWGQYSHLPEAQFLQPDQERLQWEAEIDAYGAHLRRWAYYYILEDSKMCRRFWGQYEPQIPKWQRKLLPLIYPFLAVAIKFMLKVNEKSAERSLQKVHEMFDRVDSILEDGRKTLLGGDHPCFVDITFAALTGVVLMPENYGNGTIEDTRPKVEMFSDPAHSEILRLRARPTGKMVMRFYQESRSIA